MVLTSRSRDDWVSIEFDSLDAFVVFDAAGLLPDAAPEIDGSPSVDRNTAAAPAQRLTIATRMSATFSLRRRAWPA
jgi:hypothetical protein